MSMRILSALAAIAVLLASAAQAHEHGGGDDPTQYAVDAAHTQVGFAVRHLGIVNVRGVFTDYEATMSMIDEDFTTTELEFTIQAASIDTGVERRDDHLRSEDYFEVETYPEITFVSTGVERHGTGHAMTGQLTIKGVTQDVTLPVTFGGPVSDAWGNTRVGVELSGEINRHDFGVAYDATADKSISDTVRLDVQIQAIQE